MKRSVFLLLPAIFGVIILAKAQDTLVTENGNKVVAKVIAITPTHIKYVKNANYPKTTFEIKTNAVRTIRYSNGSVDSLKNVTKGNEDITLAGKEDADIYYRRYKGVRAATAVTTVFCGAIGGLIPAIMCSSVEPATKRLGYPDSTLMLDQKYNDAYREEAKHIKSKQVWDSYVLGIAIDVSIVAVAVVVATMP
jgi:hypothetical protein